MRLRRGLAVAALFFAGLGAGDVEAAPPTPPGVTATPASQVSLRAAPIFGTDAAAGEGWVELVVTVDNAGAAPAKGTLELASSYGGYASGSDSHFLARAPFHVQPRAEAVIRVPVRGETYSTPTLTVSARGDDGGKLAETTTSLGTSEAPLLVDLDEPSRLSVVMRAWPLTPGWRPASSPYASPGTSMPISVGSPAIDPTTGDAVLPEHPAGYASATVVVVPSERLGRLQGAELDALVGWVLAGGTLAVFPTRPEDLRAGVLTTLAGGAVATQPPPSMMMTLPGAFRSAGPPPMPSPPPTMPSPWAPSIPPPVDAGGATPIGWFVPARTTIVGSGAAVGPSNALRGKLVGYAGGNLRPTEYGATAAYGLGQMHVLGFDPTASPALEDPWMHARMLDMLGDAWDRRALQAFPNGSGTRGSNLYEVHRALDPNENFRPALGIAAILLVLYSIAVGPLTFLRAARRGRPLDPLVWAPLASATCFALIVVVGLAGKGWSGRGRHIALVEAGAGMSRGSARRFRGFFASQTRAMRVRASEPTSVLEVVTTDTRSQGNPVLRLDKDGASLEDLTSLPWQTVVVSEDGFTELGSGIAVREKSDGSVVVANHTGRELKNVIVWAPKMDARFFATVAAGDTVLSSGGRALFDAASRRSVTAGTRAVHPIDLGHLTSVLGHGSDDVVTQ
ncbi:MAG TPA: hypothetical protein VHS09_05840, partial [Polyangiaceae bacterium]|nr:hypothetical protein [Polyangiaceae bacterium]